jgi:hypothetical protein
MAEAVDYYLANYLPPLVSVPMETAAAEFMRDREAEVSVSVVVDYRKVMRLLLPRFLADHSTPPQHSILGAVMATWGHSKKSWSNVRTYPIGPVQCGQCREYGVQDLNWKSSAKVVRVLFATAIAASEFIVESTLIILCPL